MFWNTLQSGEAEAVDQRLDFFAVLAVRTHVRLIALVITHIVRIEDGMNRMTVAFLHGGKDGRNAHDMTLLFVSCPSPDNWNYARHEALQAYADSVGVSFLDLNLAVAEIGLDGQTDFRDENGDHLSHYGATKTSIYLATVLDETYDLPDHREDLDYENWNTSLAQYRQNHPTTPAS